MASRFNVWSHMGRRDTVFASLLSVVMIAGFVLDGRWYLALLAAMTVVAVAPSAAEALSGLRKKRFNIELFNVLAVVASIALQEWFSAAFIALMLTAARILDGITEGRSKRALEELMKLRPTSIYVERGSELVSVGPAELRPDDVVVVREGETIPVDGEVVGGEAVVSEAPVTGESRPVLKVRGSSVLSPSLVIGGALRLRSQRVGADTTLERIIRLVAAAQEAKSPTLRLADRFVGYFLPAVVLIAIGAYFVTGTPEAAIAIMVVACADDVAVSVPLAFLAAVGAAARHGVIVNGGEALERMGKASTVFFDKTGTLTFGEPRVESYEVAAGVDEMDFWRLVGSMEKYSKHPFSGALRDAVAERLIVPEDPERFETVSGRGIQASVGGMRCVAGSREFLVGEGVSELPEGDNGAWFFACDGSYMGRALVTDSPRPEAKAAIGELRRIGVRRIVMLTGDAEEQARKVAASLGIEEVKSRLLPEDKLTAIREAQEAGEVVVMVGDGVNDAPALAAADVGVAMGQAGTAVAVETAPVVIMGDDLRLIAEVIGLSRGTRRVVAGDFGIWGVTNLFGMSLVFLGIMGPPVAAAYNFLTDFLPLINSARLFGWRSGNGRHS